jgi:hypothetical protein
MLELLEPDADAVLSRDDHLLPLPEEVDTQAVVLAGMLAGGMRPLLLDASAVRRVEPRAETLLLSLLRVKQQAGFTASLRNASRALRRHYAGHALAAFFEHDPGAAEDFLTCPDRDGDGYQPSER